MMGVAEAQAHLFHFHKHKPICVIGADFYEFYGEAEKEFQPSLQVHMYNHAIRLLLFISVDIDTFQCDRHSM